MALTLITNGQPVLSISRPLDQHQYNNLKAKYKAKTTEARQLKQITTLLALGLIISVSYSTWLIQTMPPVLTDKQIAQQAQDINYTNAQKLVSSVPKEIR